MSLRFQQYAALRQTRAFLRDLLETHTRPKTVKEMKVRALACLHHFPPLYDTGQPIWSEDEFTEDK